MKAIEVEALPDYSLQVTFADGISGILDLKNFIQKGVFAVLQNKQEFEKVYYTDYSLAWNEDLEIDLMTVYTELANKASNKSPNSGITYATN